MRRFSIVVVSKRPNLIVGTMGGALKPLLTGTINTGTLTKVSANLWLFVP
jgi:hypothetical protein